MYLDGSPFNKSVNYAFDEQSTRFGLGPCAILKQGVVYLPRDIDCSIPSGVMCLWRGKCFFSNVGKELKGQYHEIFDPWFFFSKQYPWVS
jgi:hypothetical protein